MPNDEGDYNFLRRELTTQEHDEHGHPKDNGNLATDAAALSLGNIEAYNITSYELRGVLMKEALEQGSIHRTVRGLPFTNEWAVAECCWNLLLSQPKKSIHLFWFPYDADGVPPNEHIQTLAENENLTSALADSRIRRLWRGVRLSQNSSSPHKRRVLGSALRIGSCSQRRLNDFSVHLGEHDSNRAWGSGEIDPPLWIYSYMFGRKKVWNHRRKAQVSIGWDSGRASARAHRILRLRLRAYSIYTKYDIDTGHN
ncbi:hypothetical protein ARMGADRAFT_1057206 [Armillaria gallica]|uniref:Uncharacterized protein n=1 Tax=Armillaria gallica TaxID=47427 RepID=A0A2H3EEL1_ARMGA|nr:hypothetical protein ARMGADRAFT_1057206 [Armillaria gallica]